MPPKTQPQIDHDTHNHQQCIDTALTTAKELCRKRVVKLTPIRERVLTMILQSHEPCGAYAILDALATGSETVGAPAPPTVYRALEFLLEQRLIHRIASLNAYIACCRPARSHEAHFLICQQCRQVLELSAAGISNAIDATAKEQGFTAAQACLEIFGTCGECRKQLEVKASQELTPGFG